MITAILWLAAAVFVALVWFFGWALCAAAKRGDAMDDELAQFSHRWVERS